MKNLNQIKFYNLTKDDLIKLYCEQNQTLDEIALTFSFKSRTPVRNALLKHNIEIRTKKESSKIFTERKNTFSITKEQLQHDINTFSILKLTKRYNIPRGKIYKLMEEYGVKNNYYKNLDIKEKIKQESDELSPKDLSLKYNVTTRVVNRFKKNFNDKLYSIEEIKEKIKLYNYDISNKGFPKQLFYDDKNLYNSILYHTKNHKVKTDKITEKLYRIVNDLDKDYVQFCSNCNQNELSFLTFEIGYGNSDYKLCGNCNNVLNGVSKLSQTLFWEIYNSLKCAENCFFHELNHEFILNMENDFKLKHTKANKKWYKLDFLFYKKIIEFDGIFYHKDKEKDDIADKFFKSKGYQILRISELEYNKSPKETIEKCLIYLNQL